MAWSLAAPEEIVLDVDATDDPLHGAQEGRFFHGYYGCYCYLPLYIFCGRQPQIAGHDRPFKSAIREHLEERLLSRHARSRPGRPLACDQRRRSQRLFAIIEKIPD